MNHDSFVLGLRTLLLNFLFFCSNFLFLCSLLHFIMDSSIFKTRIPRHEAKRALLIYCKPLSPPFFLVCAGWPSQWRSMQFSRHLIACLYVSSYQNSLFISFQHLNGSPASVHHSLPFIIFWPLDGWPIRVHHRSFLLIFDFWMTCP